MKDRFRSEPLSAYLHFIPRGLRPVHAALISTLRSSLDRAGGWVILTTRGRKTGLPREVLLPCARADGTIVVISTYGERSDWIRNLRKDPHVRVTCDGHVVPARAEVVNDLARKRKIVSEHPFFPAAPFAVVHAVALTALRPVLVAFLRRWVTHRPVVIIRLTDRAASPNPSGPVPSGRGSGP